MATNYNSFVYDQPDATQGQTNNEIISFTFGIFFDGTQNNKYNVNARKLDLSVYPKYSNKDDDSYTNDSTNVERLFKGYSFDNKSIFSIYIEGHHTRLNLQS